MILDANLIFSAAQAVTVTAPSSGVIDLAGTGVGNAPGSSFGTGTVFGEDIGIGDGPSPPQVDIVVTEAFTAGGAGTLQPQLQGAIDDGTYNPGTWNTIIEMPAIGKADLTVGAKIGFPIPPLPPGQAKPRFLRLNYIVAVGPMTAGKVNAEIVTGRDNAPVYPAAY